MQDSIREEDGAEIASRITGATVFRSTVIQDVRGLLAKQLRSYKMNSVRWAVVKKTIAALEEMEKPKRSAFVPRHPPKPKKHPLDSFPAHRLDGYPCPVCGRELKSVLGGVRCQNGHTQP